MKLKWCMTVLSLYLLALPAWSQEAGPELSLRDCVRIALENNPDVQTYANIARSAGNNVRASYSNILPTVGITYQGGRTRAGDATSITEVQTQDPVTGDTIFVNREASTPGYTRDFYSVSLNVNQNIFDGGNWWNAIKQSKADRAAADYSYESQINEVIRLVSQEFFDLLKHEKLYEVYDLAVQRSQDNLDKSQKMFEIGSVAKVDVFRAQVNLGNDRIALIQQRNTVQQARQTLNIAMGRDPHAPISVRREFAYEYTVPSLDELTQTAYENQPEISRLEMETRSNELSAGLAKSSFWPTLGAFFSYQRNNSQFDQIYTDVGKNWSISLGLSGRWNLFNGFADQVRVQNAKIAHKNAQLALENYKRNLKSAITNNYNSYKNLEEIVEINKENLKAAQEEYRLATERYRLGSGTSLDVRESQVNLTDAERILVAAEYDLIITYAQLLESLGTIQALFKE